MKKNIIINSLSGFHFCSHISFILFNHYPKFKNNKVLYNLFTSTDGLTHALLYKKLLDKQYMFWVIWHIIKGLDKSMKLRKLKIMNYLEIISYTNAFIRIYPQNIIGVLLYILARYYDLTW
jgi:hypothetical protein